MNIPVINYSVGNDTESDFIKSLGSRVICITHRITTPENKITLFTNKASRAGQFVILTKELTEEETIRMAIILGWNPKKYCRGYGIAVFVKGKFDIPEEYISCLSRKSRSGDNQDKLNELYLKVINGEIEME